MTQEIPRRRLSPVQLRAQHSAQIPNRDLHGVGDAALRLARDVVRRPRKHDGHGRVDACGGEEGAQVRDAWAVLGKEEDVSYAADG